MSKVIVKLESYEGMDTRLICDPSPMYVIVDTETGMVADYGYRTFEDVAAAWPDATNARPRIW